jgi:hypothetical protein
VRRVGNDPSFHYEIAPDADTPDTGIEIRYREWDDTAKQWVVKGSVSFSRDLDTEIAAAIVFVSKHMGDD